jgi:M6 family metalloprotease-like protein
VPNTFGAQKTLVMLVNFQDNPTQPYTLDYARSVVFGTTSNFYLENSYQQAWLTGDVFGWYTVPLASTTCDSGGIATYAEAAATAAGVNLSAYTHRVYAFPNAACAFGGAATVGGNPSRAWINGSGNMSLGTVGHELGHNLGLLHSHSFFCDGTTMTGTCTTLEYGDGLDIMGWSNSGHFNAFQKERLGWLNYGVSPPITTVTASGSYAVAPYEAADTNPKALKLLKHTDPTTGAREWYYVELRRAIGFDSYLATVGGPYQVLSSNILNGVEIRWGSESSSDSSRLLDMTPGSVDPYTGTVDLYTNDPALTVGNSFSDPDAGVTLTVASVDGSAAVVSVTLTTPTCTRANPTVAVSPSPGPGVPAGTAVTYTVSVTNNDGAGCGTSSFSLQTMMLPGWTAAFAASALTLSSGTSTSTTFTVTSPPSVTGTSYTLPVVVTNSASASYQATSSAVYVIGSTVVGSTLNVAVSTDKPSYTGNQIVSVTARASSGGSPVANAAVTFTITKSDGGLVSQTATTDSTGSAVVKYRLQKSDPRGAYKARADATKTPLSGSAVTSFTVK